MGDQCDTQTMKQDLVSSVLENILVNMLRSPPALTNFLPDLQKLVA